MDHPKVMAGIFLVIGVLGIAMAATGIQFYKKCEKGQPLNKTNYQWLTWMLVGFCIIVLVSIGIAVHSHTKSGA